MPSESDSAQTLFIDVDAALEADFDRYMHLLPVSEVSRTTTEEGVLRVTVTAPEGAPSHAAQMQPVFHQFNDGRVALMNIEYYDANGDRIT